MRRVTWSTTVLAAGRLVHAGTAGFGFLQPQVNLSTELNMKTPKLPMLV